MRSTADTCCSLRQLGWSRGAGVGFALRDLPSGAANSRDWFRPEGFTALRVLTSQNPTSKKPTVTGITLIPPPSTLRSRISSRLFPSRKNSIRQMKTLAGANNVRGYSSVRVARQCPREQWHRGACFARAAAANQAPKIDGGKSPRRYANHYLHNRPVERESYRECRSIRSGRTWAQSQVRVCCPTSMGLRLFRWMGGSPKDSNS